MSKALSVITGPLVSEGVSAGKGFLLRLTDSLDVVIYPGVMLSFAVTGDKADPAQECLSMVVPLYFANRSKLKDGLVRNLSAELVGLGDRKDGRDPYHDAICLAGAFLVDSLDFCERECQLAARALREQDAKVEAELEEYRYTGRKTLESLLLPPGRMLHWNVEYRCKLKVSGRRYLAGGFKVHLKAEFAFPEALTDKAAHIAEFDVQTNFDLFRNTQVRRGRLDSGARHWDEIVNEVGG